MHKYSLLNSKSADIPEKWLLLSDINFIITVSYCKSHCTEPLYSIVSLCTPLYKVTALHCTPMDSTVSTYWPALYLTVRHCTGYWHCTLLLPTVPISLLFMLYTKLTESLLLSEKQIETKISHCLQERERASISLYIH